MVQGIHSILRIAQEQQQLKNGRVDKYLENACITYELVRDLESSEEQRRLLAHSYQNVYDEICFVYRKTLESPLFTDEYALASCFIPILAHAAKNYITIPGSLGPSILGYPLG